jgi:imidazolonepropionase-like amidohydrolase
MKGLMMGLSFHHELWLYVNRCGKSPIEALKSATSVPARRFGLNDRGVIAKGMQADLLLVDGDATSSIECTKSIVDVWRRGVRFARK